MADPLPGLDAAAAAVAQALAGLRAALESERHAADSLEDAYGLDTLLHEAEAIERAYVTFVESMGTLRLGAIAPSEDPLDAFRAAATRIAFVDIGHFRVQVDAPRQ